MRDERVVQVIVEAVDHTAEAIGLAVPHVIISERIEARRWKRLEQRVVARAVLSITVDDEHLALFRYGQLVAPEVKPTARALDVTVFHEASLSESGLKDNAQPAWPRGRLAAEALWRRRKIQPRLAHRIRTGLSFRNAVEPGAQAGRVVELAPQIANQREAVEQSNVAVHFLLGQLAERLWRERIEGLRICRRLFELLPAAVHQKAFALCQRSQQSTIVRQHQLLTLRQRTLAAQQIDAGSPPRPERKGRGLIGFSP